MPYGIYSYSSGLWHDGKLTGVRARGNFVVDLYWKDNNLTKAVVYSGSGVPCKIYYKGKKIEFETSAGKSYTVTLSDAGELSVK